MSKIPKAKPLIDILCITAHPDDELLCAGAIAHHARNGKSVVIAVTMAGDKGVPFYDENMPPNKLADLRRSELLNSARTLGAQRVEFLGFEDHEQNFELRDDLCDITQRIKVVIEEHRPRIILTHGPDGEYGHPDHKAVSEATTQALGLLDKSSRPLLYYCRAYYPDAPLHHCNVSVEANYVFPVTGRNFQAHHDAMHCHVSQLKAVLGFSGRGDAIECYHRLGEANENSAWFEAVPD